MDLLKKIDLNDDKAGTDSLGSTHSTEQQDKSLFDTISGNHKHENSHPTGAVNTEESGLLGRISNAMGEIQSHSHSSTVSQPAQSHAPQKEGFFGRMSDGLDGGGKHGEHKTEEGLLGKIGNFGGRHEESPKPQSFGDKINAMLGGGAPGEKKEDTLDKAIDFVQEHILGAGQQKNESAVEQLKDEQIADVIRHEFKNLTGKDFPGGNRK